MKLHHTVNHTPMKARAKAIKTIGIMPQVADEYKDLVPEKIRHLPVVWLTEGIWQSRECPVFEVDTKYLDGDKLHRVEFLLEDNKNLKWWIYQGHIPPNVITKLI